MAPSGVAAEAIADLWWVLLAGATVVWAAVIGVAVYAVYVRPGPHDAPATRLLVIGGGAVAPTVILTALLVFSLTMMPTVYPQIPEEGRRLTVSGERWWWRVVYRGPDGQAIPLANEIRLPVGRPSALSLESPDVIHSFWIPSLAGKMDMIPGRTNLMVLEPTRTGVYRGACAEFCGTSHALMQFDVVVMEEPAFDAWLAGQAAPAAEPATAEAARGGDLFLAYGCGACHAVRGTPAAGTVGPDLTHVGGRISLGARVLPNDPAGFKRWIADTHAVKPDVLMPSFGMLSPDDLSAVALYLDGLT